MDEETALLRAIATDPDDDTPRLVFADWCDEHDRPARAEFIRLQCELAQVDAIEHDCGENGEWTTTCPACGAYGVAEMLRGRVRELFEAHGAEWVPVPAGHTLMVALLDASGCPCANVAYARDRVKVTGDMRFYFDRGFCSEWWAPLDDVVGEEWECPHCENRSPDWETNVVECRRCDSTGVTGWAGHAGTVFGSHPVERVTVATQSPDMVIIHDGTDRWIWRRWPDVDTREILPGYLPGFLFDFLGEEEFIPGTAFTSRELAEVALSRRIVSLGRSRAEPPLPPLR